VGSGPGITIDAPHILVYLRGLTLNGQPGGTDGIVYTRAGRVVVDHCQINRMPGRSIVATASVGTLLVRDTTLTGSGSPAVDLPGTITVNLDRVTIDTTSGGPAVYVIGGADVSINDSSIVRNFGRGLEIFAQSGATARVAVAKSLVAQNGDVGIVAGTDTSGAKYYLTVSDSTVFRNFFGIYLSTYSGGQGTATITGNTISENGSASGVVANGGGSTTVVLAGNTITRNYNGIDNVGATIKTPANNNVAQNTNADVIGTALTPLVQK